MSEWVEEEDRIFRYEYPPISFSNKWAENDFIPWGARGYQPPTPPTPPTPLPPPLPLPVHPPAGMTREER